MRRGLLIVLLLLVCCACSASSSCDNTRPSQDCLRVLFVGNSYTFVNDLPNTFAALANAGGRRVHIGMVANGGWTLEQHASSTPTLNQLAPHQWEYVVLQEQSQIPSIPRFRSATMYPAVRSLVKRIRQSQATPLLFQTWAHRDGWLEMGLPDAARMQAQLNAGYGEIGRELNVRVIPVGTAWLAAHARYPELQLWQDDGSHPSEQGTYLAACVMYAAISGASPEGLSYHGSVSSDIAGQLQTIAADAVLNNRR